jgi:hypothetical protein
VANAVVSTAPMSGTVKMFLNWRHAKVPLFLCGGWNGGIYIVNVEKSEFAGFFWRMFHWAFTDYSK